MKEYIALDSHKHYSLLEREDVASGRICHERIEHRAGAIREALAGCEPGTPVAVEASGNWYWIVDEIEQANQVPQLVHPLKAKLMMGNTNKTDKLDVHGLNRLQRTGTLPTIWISPSSLRDLRELTRTRIFLARERTRLKNRIQSTLGKYGHSKTGYSDPFGKKARVVLSDQIDRLPARTGDTTRMLLAHLDFVIEQIGELERRLRELVQLTPEMELLKTAPGIGIILAATIMLEIGDVNRFPSAEHLASYSGTTPRVHASGDKVRYGRLRSDVNRYLKWGFVEAANSVAVNSGRRPQAHVSQLYRRLRGRKGHSKAVGAVARHLSEVAFHILSRRQEYREPTGRTRSNQAGPSAVMS